MNTIDRIASRQSRRDEQPNFELARALVAANDSAGIDEIASHLQDRDQSVRSDCIKVLYEAGELSPELIAPHAGEFVRLLGDKNNRMIWGGMSVLATIAIVAADELDLQFDQIQAAIARGSVITVDAGVKVMAGIASTSSERNARIFPYLLDHLRHCRAKEVPQHSESTLVAVNGANRAAFIDVLEARMAEFTAPQLARIRRVIKAAR